MQWEVVNKRQTATFEITKTNNCWHAFQLFFVVFFNFMDADIYERKRKRSFFDMILLRLGF